jgi:hypothetical protein
LTAVNLLGRRKSNSTKLPWLMPVAGISGYSMTLSTTEPACVHRRQVAEAQEEIDVIDAA